MIASGCVKIRRSLLPLRSLANDPEALAAKSVSLELVALDHRAHGAVEIRMRSLARFFERPNENVRPLLVEGHAALAFLANGTNAEEMADGENESARLLV
ncbi:hypothetical protein [Methylocystis parvus]|uniref:hypothetical protein n=1 Tax=Methylocystis parvus TaxID=134 RepID=UPI003C715B80